MKTTAYVLVASVLFFGSAALASAAVTPLTFYCDPYAAGFIEGQAYDPLDGGTCTFSTPSPVAGDTEYVVFRGTPGNSPELLTSNQGVTNQDGMQTENIGSITFSNVGSPVPPGQNFFAASFGGGVSNLATWGEFFENGGTAPGDYSILDWEWGAPMTVAADTATSTTGAAIPILTATLSGFINGDTLATSGITGSASCTTTATSASAPGDYPVTCTRGTLSSTKYAFDTFVGGTLHLVAPPPPAPTCTLSASPASITQGQSSTLTFSSTNATGGVIDQGVGAVAANGTASVSPSATTLYADTVSGAGGTTTCSTSVNVTPVVTDKQPPVISINTPVQNGLYAKTDSVFLTATVTDQSTIATTTYWFGTKKINPAQALPLSTVSTPSVQTVSVSASDIYGNTATSTLKFFVVKSTNSCLADIVSVLVLITQDKTFPSKPTLVQLISDCSALLKGKHRGY